MIGSEFEDVGPTLLKNPLSVGWGSLPTLRCVGPCLSTYLTSMFRQIERRFHNVNQNANHSIRKWVFSTMTRDFRVTSD